MMTEHYYRCACYHRVMHKFGCHCGCHIPVREMEKKEDDQPRPLSPASGVSTDQKLY